MPSVQHTTHPLIKNEKIATAHSTNSANSKKLTFVMYTLYEGIVVHKDFYDRIERHVEALLSSRPYKGRPMKVRDFFLSGFWRALTTKERRIAGMCLEHIFTHVSKPQEA